MDAVRHLNRTRRRVLIGTGTLAAGTIGAVALTGQEASAAVTGEFAVPDAETVVTDEQIQDVRLTADTEWSFEANAPMTGVEIELHVGAAADTLDLIARTEQRDLSTDALEGTDTLAGSLMSAADFDIEDFRTDSGEVTTTVVAAIKLFVLRDGSVEAEARHQTAFDVTVSSQEVSVTTTFGGEGEVSFQTG